VAKYSQVHGIFYFGLMEASIR